MPLIHVKLSSSKIENSQELLQELSKELSDLTGKPEQYVMCILETNIPMLFSGSEDPCCYVEVKSIGSLTPPVMTKTFTKLIERKTGISSDRIYISFEDIQASKWGFNGQTFG